MSTVHGVHRALAGGPQRHPGRGPGQGRGRLPNRRAGHGPGPPRRPADAHRRPARRSRTPSPRGRDRRLDQRRAPSARHRPRVRDPARHRRVRGDRRPDAARRRHAARAAATRRPTCTRRAASRWSCASCSSGPGLLHGDAPTVDGRTIAEIAAGASRRPARRSSVPLETPLKPTGGLAILHGSLAPDGCVVKLAGHERRQHRGPARVFDSETACYEAVRDAADRARRRRRHPLRGPGRRPGHAGDAAGDRPRSSARGWAIRSRC